MPEILQFHCPACGISLRIPMAAAGQDGPCPRCAQLICAPDPAHHLPPRRLSPPGSIHAMMERLSKARTTEVASPPVETVADIPPTAPQAAPTAPPAAESIPYTPPEPPARPAPEPVPEPPPILPIEPVRVKYPPFDPPTPAPLPAEPRPAPPQPEPQPLTYITPVVEPVREEPPPVPVRPLPPPPVSAPVEEEPQPQPVTPPPRQEEPQLASEAPTDRSAAPFSRPLRQTSDLPPTLAAVLPKPEKEGKSQRAILLLSCGLTGLAALIAGFAIGYYVGNRFPITSLSAPASPAAVPPAATPVPQPGKTIQEPPPSPEPVPTPSKTIPPEPVPEPVKDSAPSTPEPPPISEPDTPPAGEGEPSAEIPLALAKAVEGFLTAPDRASRIRYMLHPERTRAKLESWHKEIPYQPFKIGSLWVEAKTQSPETRLTSVIFIATNDRFPEGLPVIAQDTGEGWKVDWESFVEFENDEFGRFSSSAANSKGTFHLYLRNTHYFGKPFAGSDKLTAFRIDSALPDRTKYAFVASGSDLHKRLATITDWGAPCAAVLDLTLRNAKDGQSYIEITGLVSQDWIPR